MDDNAKPPIGPECRPETHVNRGQVIADLNSEVVRLAVKLTKAKATITELEKIAHIRNLELDALYIVWCDGGCEEGMARYSGEHPTLALVEVAERNAKRMRAWYTNHNAKQTAKDKDDE